MTIHIELDKEDVKQAVSYYVSNALGHTVIKTPRIIVHPGSIDPRESSSGYATATVEIAAKEKNNGN